MSDCRFGVSPVNYPDPDPEPFFDNNTKPRSGNKFVNCDREDNSHNIFYCFLII